MVKGIGKRIKGLRKKNNITQEKLAYMLYVSRERISLWETEKISVPAEFIISMSKIFKCTTDEILKGEPEIE